MKAFLTVVISFEISFPLDVLVKRHLVSQPKYLTMLTSDNKFHHSHHMEGLHEEKKVRVEQVVMALSKGEKRKMVNHKEYEENLKVRITVQFFKNNLFVNQNLLLLLKMISFS